MKIIFYLPPKSINDATFYYTRLIKKAFNDLGFEVTIYEIASFKSTKEDIIFTIRVRDFIKVFFRFQSATLCNWFQGLGPEEYVMIHGESLKTKMIYYFFTTMEWIVLQQSTLNFFVSEKMVEHYKTKYRVSKTNGCIIPCYNKMLNQQLFDQQKEALSFVFAGALYSWQCFEKTLEIYKKIQTKLPSAHLTVLTKDIEQAKALLSEKSIVNSSVYYVSLENLDTELSKFKYGFIIRENDIVNNVSTPTKMNSYLSVGLIPIYTDVIDSFEKNIALGTYAVKLSHSAAIDEMVDRIIEHNAIRIDYKAFYERCLSIFNQYYDDGHNVEKIKKAIRKVLIK